MNDLVHRMRCRYPVGPMINGEPEFGWRDYSGPAPVGMMLPAPIMLEAADEIEKLRGQVNELEAFRDSFDGSIGVEGAGFAHAKAETLEAIQRIILERDQLREQIGQLKAVGELLLTQDNRCTDQPIFIVQEKVRDWGYSSDYAEDYEWHNRDDIEDKADEEKVAELEALDDACEDTGSWEKVYYRDRWEFVTACFTEQGCKDYIEINGHNHQGKLIIYAAGSFRNNEFRLVRNTLIEVSKNGE